MPPLSKTTSRSQIFAHKHGMAMRIRPVLACARSEPSADGVMNAAGGLLVSQGGDTYGDDGLIL